MRYILYTTEIKEPGSIGRALSCMVFRRPQLFDHWSLTSHIGGWSRFRQRRGHIQLAVDELIATGAQVCVDPNDATLVRWFTHRPLPTSQDYMLENLVGARKDSAIKRYKFRPPPDYAGRRNMPTEVVIFAPNIGRAYEGLIRKTWFRDIDTRPGALAKWLQKIEHAGCVGGDA